MISYLWSRKNLILDPAMALGWSYCAYLEATGSCTCYIAQLYISEYIFTIRLSWVMSLRNVGITGQSQIPVHGDNINRGKSNDVDNSPFVDRFLNGSPGVFHIFEFVLPRFTPEGKWLTPTSVMS